MTFSVTASVDRYVSDQNEERLPDGHWHPSSLFGCERAGVYTFLGLPKSNPPGLRSLRIFRLGHLFHEFIQSAITSDPAVRSFYPEVKVYDPDLNITGHADGLAETEWWVLEDGDILDEGTEWWVLEFKSIGGWGFKSKQLPQDDHLGQALTYAHVLKHYGGTWKVDDEVVRTFEPMPQIRGVRFCYVNKESGETKEYEVLLTDSFSAELAERVGRMNRHVTQGTLPERLPYELKAKGWEKNYLCKSYCDYRDTCWEDPTPSEVPE